MHIHIHMPIYIYIKTSVHTYDNGQFNRIWINSGLLTRIKFLPTSEEIISYEIQEPYLCTKYYLIITYNIWYVIPIITFIKQLSCLFYNI